MPGTLDVGTHSAGRLLAVALAKGCDGFEATTIQFLCAVDNPGYFEGDVTSLNPFRDQLGDKAPYKLDDAGCVRPYEGVGIGLKVDQHFISEHPLIEGPCYV